MKKLYFGMLAAGMLFTTSCSSEIDAPASGDEAFVTFEVALDGANATRAISDGLKNTTLVMAVYDVDGNEMTTIRHINDAAFKGGLTEKVSVKLAKGQTYSFAFWAQNGSCTAYNYGDLKNITVNYEGMLSNDESRDAFFGQVIDHKVTGDFTQDVILKRPFAQINLGVDDYDDAVKAGINVAQAKVVVSDVATSFNALTGAVDGQVTDLEIGLADIIHDAETLMVDLDGDGAKEAYAWLAMNYVLVNDATTGYESANADVEFTLANNREDIAIYASNVTLQRNWRTNIIGHLTNTGTFNVIVDPIYVNDHNHGAATDNVAEGIVYDSVEDVYYVTEAAGLSWISANNAALAGKTVKLAHNLDLTNENVASIEFFNSERPMTFDGAGYTIKGQTQPLFSKATVSVKNLNIEDAAISVAGSYKGAVAGTLYGDVENVTVKNSTIATTSEKGIRIGAIVGIHNAGNLTNCSAENVTVEGYHSVGGLVGFVNEQKAVRTYSNCSVNNATITNKCTTGAGAEQFGAIVGVVDASDLVLENCTATGVNAPLHGKIYAGGSVTIDGITYSANYYVLHTAEAMFWFADQVNVAGNNFAGKTIELGANIDLANKAWAPVGQTGATEFKGVFDGKGYTISNLAINNTDESKNCASGLFGWIESHGDEGVTVKNVTVDGAKVEGYHNVAVIVGYVYGTIENCKVLNATLNCVNKNDDANGDKCGTIAGYVGEDATISNCYAANSAVSAGRDAGAIVGAAKPACVTGCSFENVTVTANGTGKGTNINEAVIGRSL